MNRNNKQIKKMKRIFMVTSVVGVGMIVLLPEQVTARVTSTSSISVESSVTSEGSSSVSVHQSVQSRNNQVVVHTFREENGQVVENSRRVIGQNDVDVTPAPTPRVNGNKLRGQIREQVNQETEREVESALDEFNTELDEIERDTRSALDDAEEEIREEKTNIQNELDEIAEETGAEEELRQQWEERLDQEELSFWERLRDWFNERIERLSK